MSLLTLILSRVWAVFCFFSPTAATFDGAVLTGALFPAGAVVLAGAALVVAIEEEDGATWDAEVLPGLLDMEVFLESMTVD